MARTLKNVKKEKQTLSELEYGEKTKKLGKMRHTHLRTKNMARNSENVKNETYTLQQLDYGKKTDQQGK